MKWQIFISLIRLIVITVRVSCALIRVVVATCSCLIHARFWECLLFGVSVETYIVRLHLLISQTSLICRRRKAKLVKRPQQRVHSRPLLSTKLEWSPWQWLCWKTRLGIWRNERSVRKYCLCVVIVVNHLTVPKNSPWPLDRSPWTSWPWPVSTKLWWNNVGSITTPLNCCNTNEAHSATCS